MERSTLVKEIVDLNIQFRDIREDVISNRLIMEESYGIVDTLKRVDINPLICNFDTLQTHLALLEKAERKAMRYKSKYYNSCQLVYQCENRIYDLRRKLADMTDNKP